MNDWHVSASREVFANLVLRLDLERIRTPAGDETDWTVVTIGDGAAVCPIHEDGSVTLIRQYRHALGRTLWEFETFDKEERGTVAIMLNKEADHVFEIMENLSDRLGE